MFSRIPFVGYLCLLLFGIFLSNVLVLRDDSAILAVLVSSTFVIGVGTYFSEGRSRWIKVGAPLGIVVLGWAAANWQVNRLRQAIDSIEGKNYQAYEVVFNALPDKTDRNLRYEVIIEKLYNHGEHYPVHAKGLIYLKSDLKNLPVTGDRWMIYGQLQRPSRPRSAMGFDYKKYLERNEIAWIGYIRHSEQVGRLPSTKQSNQLAVWAAILSEQSDLLFRAYIPDDDAYALVKAMILGRRDAISPELNNAFINSGTVHILSVSGLHIAIFFAGLNMALGFLKRIKGGKYLYLVVMTTILTGYSIVTGLPASVQRATLMCIVWMIAATFSRRHEPVNTLAIAGFVILLANPNAIVDVGFQLSFLAMLGIFLWSKPIASIYLPTNRIVAHLWELSVMSIVAQVATFPLVTYYFNQFPTYFLFANLLAVDIAGLLIPASFLLLLMDLTGIEFLTVLAGVIVNYLAIITNSIVRLPEKLPCYLIDYLYLDAVESTLLLALILVVYRAYVLRRASAVHWILFTSLGICLYSSITVINDFQQTFVERLDTQGTLLYKKPGKLYLIENDEIRPASAYQLRKYRARYGKDTTRIKLH